MGIAYDYDPAPWANFFVAEVGASAALVSCYSWQSRSIS